MQQSFKENPGQRPNIKTGVLIYISVMSSNGSPSSYATNEMNRDAARGRDNVADAAAYRDAMARAMMDENAAAGAGAARSFRRRVTFNPITTANNRNTKPTINHLGNKWNRPTTYSTRKWYSSDDTFHGMSHGEAWSTSENRKAAKWDRSRSEPRIYNAITGKRIYTYPEGGGSRRSSCSSRSSRSSRSHSRSRHITRRRNSSI